MKLANCLQDACQQFANSVSSLPPDDAERVGRDPGGSRVLEALVAGAASGKQKARLLRALHGRWAGLAAEFAGSHLVEKCFAAAVRALAHICLALCTRHLGPSLPRGLYGAH